MITFFRKFFQSKAGIAITLAFLALIAFAFASSDVANNATFGGVTGGDRVASVGDERISTSDLATAVNQQIDQLRQENPTITMEQIVADDGVAAILDQLIQRVAIAEYGREMGLRSGNRLIDSEIAAIPGLQSADGSFDQEGFRNILAQRGISEAMVREDIMLNLFARQVVLPVAQEAALPASVLARYTALLGETRQGQIASFPATAFAPTGEPEEGVLQAYYTQNAEDFRRPERRTLRYGVFTEAVLDETPAPSAAAIRNRYSRDEVVYAARELRTFTQLIAPTQAAAQAVVNEVNNGVSLESSAQSKGLTTTTLTDLDRATLASRTSEAAAQAGFAANSGAITAPAQGGLGWYVLRVDNVQQIAGQSLEQASPAIAAQLVAETRQAKLNELTARIEDDFADGRSLSEVAEDLGIELVTTPPLLASGQIYDAQEAAPQILMPAINIGFQLDEGDPQLGETVAGEQFLVFDVAQISESAVPPLSQISDEVTLAWRRDEGMAGASAAATRVRDKVRGGMTLAAAVAQEEAQLLQPAPLTLSREQYEQQVSAQQGNIPRPIELFFAMAQGTVKRTQQPDTSRWFVVELDEITTVELPTDNPRVQGFALDMQRIIPQELSAQYVAGIESAVETETNQAGIDAVIAQLTGQTN